VIEVRSVSHRAAGRTVLDAIDLRLDEPRIAVIGANGSGKSTFVRLLNGLLLPTEGEVSVDGFDTRTDGKNVRRRVGLVFQNPDLQIVLPTVVEDIGFGLRRRDIDADEVTRRVEEALASAHLTSHRDHPAHLRSGGQKQLLPIWCMLELEQTWMVFDEPTTLLDRRNTREVTDLIMALPMNTIVATHDLELAGRCDRVILIDEGRVAADGTPQEAIDAYLAATS
jgi:biotin transport system ATP-binding protein